MNKNPVNKNPVNKNPVNKTTVNRNPAKREPPDRSALSAVLSRSLGQRLVVTELERLSGGASAETWRIVVAATPSGDGRGGNDRILILRRAPSDRSENAIALETEAEIQRSLVGSEVPLADIVSVLSPGDQLGSGYVMEFIAGETIARKILRDERFAVARRRMARQCGRILAAIHSAQKARLPALPVLDGPAQLQRYEETYRACDEPHPVFELAFEVLRDRFPAVKDSILVHGDFRNGNLIVGEDGVAAVIDWELAHLGDPMEDLGWLCVNSWRFGIAENPVGGFGSYADLFDGYQEAGGTLDRERVRIWEIFGTLKWGIMCMMQGHSHLKGARRSVEKAAIGRRTSESEADLVQLLLQLAKSGDSRCDR